MRPDDTPPQYLDELLDIVRRINGKELDISIYRQRKTFLSLIVAVLLLCGAADFPAFAHPEPPAGQAELDSGWKLVSAKGLAADGAAISRPDYQDADWHRIGRMPASVLEALQEDGTYPDLYVGKNLLEDVPQDLYAQDWWYRKTFDAPAGHSTYQLDFPQINYRAEIWLNGHRVAGATQIVGMYSAHELDVTNWINRGGSNTLAVKVTPERTIQNVNGVELADSWYDWINWNYLGYRGPGKVPTGNSFVPDRNAGILKPVALKYSGAVSIGPATVNTELPLPKTDSARLTVFTSVQNHSAREVRGVLRATISRTGKPSITVRQPITLQPREDRQVRFDPATFPELTVADPDLWWPYTMGAPNLYDLHLEFVQYGSATEDSTLRFGVRSVTQHRDRDAQFPELGEGGSFYLQVNGKDFLVRGAAYTPDLLYKFDPGRESAILHYAKDLGLNMLRLESKLPGAEFMEQADELGIPVMLGWMCCNQWERWSQWDDEDRQVAKDSLRSQILMLRSHPSAFIWANGSDGKPPPSVLDEYHAILGGLHWQNATVDTVSSFAQTPDGRRDWDGIHMAGPYSWRPPTYWFDGRYRAARGANAEQGDNEHIPPFASLKKFIPPDKLWPMNDTWYFHAGSNPSNSTLTSIRRAVDRRYGYSSGAEEFAKKAQLAHFEATRAQFESFAANGWDTHKMTIYWMLNSHWPSFFGNLFDYYLRPGGAYYGAKQGLRPLSVVFDSYATGNHNQANVTVVNQTPGDQSNLRVRVRFYDLQGRVRDDRTAAGLTVKSGDATRALVLPRVAVGSRVYFVRCQLLDGNGTVITDNLYWQSQQRDDVGDPRNDAAFANKQASWADMTALNSMPRVPLQVTARRSPAPGVNGVAVALHNPTRQVAFFERAEIMSTRDGDEILPIEYSNNYVTVFPGETVELQGVIPAGGAAANWVRVSGYNSPPVVAAVDDRALR